LFSSAWPAYDSQHSDAVCPIGRDLANERKGQPLYQARLESMLTAGRYVAVNILLGSVLEPRPLGRTLGISPLIIFLSLVFWGRAS